MSDQPHKISRSEAYEHWTARHAKSILFVILTIAGRASISPTTFPSPFFPAPIFRGSSSARTTE